jgi:hypothetical protein
MVAHAPADRQRITVRGATEVLSDFAERRAAGAPAGVAAARSLARHQVDWHSARGAIVTSERAVILAEVAGGPLLAARHFDPAAPTSIHDHGGAGAAIVVEGRDRCERFERTGPTTVRLESIHDLAQGDLTWWNEPPDDIHRQHGLGDGSIQLVLLTIPPVEPTTFADTSPPASSLRAAVVEAFLAADVEGLGRWYHEDVLADANLPERRFQLRGRPTLLDLIHNEEFAKHDRRMTFMRATDTSDGLLLETEVRFTEGGELRVCREAHHLRVRHGLVVEHVLWCTGVADAAAAAEQVETARLERA